MLFTFLPALLATFYFRSADMLSWLHVYFQVDEETIEAAKERQKKGGLFYPETWGAIAEHTWTLEQIVSGKANSQ